MLLSNGFARHSSIGGATAALLSALRVVSTMRNNYTGKKYGPNDEYASRQEMRVSLKYPQITFQPPVRIYYTVDHYYLPDWRLGVDSITNLSVYVEGKERFEHEMELKYTSIVDSNPRMMLLILTPNILTRVKDRLNAHPRIEVILSIDEIPHHWLERTGNA